jgi:hypothetical protein
MGMLEIIFILAVLYFVGWRGRNKLKTGKYSRERQRKRYLETGNRRYLSDRDLD